MCVLGGQISAEIKERRNGNRQRAFSMAVQWRLFIAQNDFALSHDLLVEP
jgi:hypothetical protein